LLAIAFFCLILPWKFVLVLLPIMYTHELFHKYYGERIGLKVEGIRFAVWGAVTKFESGPRTYRECFLLYLAGPASGIAVSALLGILYLATGYEPLLGVMLVAVAVAIFNLLPMPIADGGVMIDSLLAALPDETRTRGMHACNWLATLGMFFLGVHPFFVAILFLVGTVGAGRGARWENAVREERERLGEEIRSEAMSIAEENKQAYPSETNIRFHQDNIRRCQERLEKKVVPRRMDTRERAYCVLWASVVIVALLSFLFCARVEYLAYLM